MGAFDDLIPDGKPAAGAFDDLLPPKAGKKSAGAFDDLVPERPSILKTVALENPLTAIVETGANLASQAVALPIAGLAGLATEAGNTLGMTDKKGANVVHQVGEAMTYQPRGEMGKATTDLATKPFQWLAEAGQWAGGKTLTATDSPALATAVDTTIQGVLPMVVGPAAKAGKSRIIGKVETAPEAIAPEAIAPEAQATNVGQAVAEPARPAGGALARDSVNRTEGLTNEHSPQTATSAKAEAGFVAETPLGGVQRLAEHESALLQPEAQAMGSIRRGGDSSQLGLAEQFREIPEGRRGEAKPEASAIAQGSDQGLLPGERGMGEAGFVGRPEDAATRRTVDGRGATALDGREAYRNEAVGTADHAGQRTDYPRTADRQAPILDPNAGPLSRSAAIARPDLVIKANEVKPDGPFADLLPGGRAAEPARGFTPLADSQTQAMAGKVQNSWAPGANYAPLIDDSLKPASGVQSVADLPAPIRRERIIKDLADVLGTTVYEGRVKGKNRLGFFRSGVEEVRTKRANDLEVAAHEIAHLIDSRIPSISNSWRSDSALREQLKSVSYDQKSVSEGFAEAVRLYLTTPETLEAKAPKAYAWLDEFANTHMYGKALKKAQADMTAWFDQDALNRARSKIGDSGKFGNSPLMQYMGDWWERQKGQLRQSVFDDLDGLYRAERSLNGKINPAGPYETARLTRASASITSGAIEFGYPVRLADGSHTFRGKGLKSIIEPIAGRLDDFMLYAVGRSAKELLGQGREHLFSAREVADMVALEKPEFRRAFAELQAWQKGILDFAQANQVISHESRQLWRRSEYIPFHRIAEAGNSKARPGEWKGIQKLTGGTENLRDIMTNIIANAGMLIDRSLKNEALLAVAEMASKPGGGKFMVKIDPTSRPVKIGGDQVLDALLKSHGISVDGPAPAFFDFMVHGQPPAGSNIIVAMRNGKPNYYEVGDPLLYRALSALDRPPQHWLVGWLGLPKRIGQATITLDPSFIAANLTRDQVMAGVMTQSGFRPVVDAMKGLKSRLAEDPTYREWIANGGGLSSLFMDEGALRKHMERFYVDHGIDPKTVLDAPGKALYFVERVGDAIESSTRIGEFSRAIEAGDNPRHAAYKSREISVDWATKGDSRALGVAFDTVMFLRAAMVSMDRVFRGVAHDQNRGAIAAKAGLIGLASAALYLMNRGDPRYDDMEDWKKDAFWHVFVGPEHFMIPKAFEVGAIGTLAERTIERTLDNDPAGLGKDAARVIGNVFGLNWKPQIIAPLYDQATNSQGLTRAKIETPGMENIQPFLRSKPSTSETIKAAGMATSNLPESLQVNPVRAEALLRGYLNSWAAYGLLASDAIFFGDKKPEMRADEMPVVKKFYTQEPPKSTKFDRDFYDMLGEAKRLQGTLRELDRQHRPDIADQKEQSPLAGEAKPLERANKNLQGINSEMRDVRRAADLTPAEKRQRLDGLHVERNQLLKDAVQAAKATQAEKR